VHMHARLCILNESGCSRRPEVRHDRVGFNGGPEFLPPDLSEKQLLTQIQQIFFGSGEPLGGIGRALARNLDVFEHQERLPERCMPKNTI